MTKEKKTLEQQLKKWVTEPGAPMPSIPPFAQISCLHIERARTSILDDPLLKFDDPPALAIDKFIARLLVIATTPTPTPTPTKRDPPIWNDDGTPSPCNICRRIYCDHPWDQAP